MDNKDYPNYFQASDKLSIDSQKYYLNIIRADLLSMIVAALLAIYSFQTTEYKLGVHILTGFSLLLGLILTIILKSKKYEDIWYQGRALAESCKTITWRFSMCSEYFESNISPEEVKERFITRIKEIANEFSNLSGSLNAKILNKEIITVKMLELRNLSVKEKKEYYIEQRIENQKKWYAVKAEWNKNKSNFWFWLIIVSQAVALISIVFLIKNPDNNWNLVGLLTTITSSAISWLQIKQHQELKQAYTTASEELNFIKELSYKVTNDEQLSEFILDSENAISREHTLWIAQRRK
jgi:prepilin signal peptidase PulO-like enzyme (type II secretory pathway)